ncbi:hypothetical protein CDD81_3043 [Ophiocordyceps australis]|uniref:Protein kinase domain-containing protein n=1 Tax=Ophiocordyceps australis TaxID=1399860 RepID=A0A2C5YJU1_9HYPO|nr:hypothetical protein CDD81_3043 [Ophiocordyceps australis]
MLRLDIAKNPSGMAAQRLVAANMEALSPRDVNAPRLLGNGPEAKSKAGPAVGQVRASKGKEHPPSPPDEVVEPGGEAYQVGRLLGKGGFAICHTGKLVADGKKFALKIVKTQMPPKIEQKFQTELQIHSKMRHKNVVHFFRAFSFDSCTYLVLELCSNGSLMDMVKRRKGLTEPEVRLYSVQIAGAIKYMHAKGISHRDLKMGNIFLDSGMNAKIGDFGLAALVVTGEDMQTIRRTTLCGTPNYIAPEILQKGKNGHDHMVDIWSLGIIMFAMLTSRPPFQSSTTDEIYRRARDRDYEWPVGEASQRYISSEAKELVATLLEDAHRRPDPDAIVQHAFFLSGYMPSQADLSSRFRDVAPDADEFYTSRLSPQLQARSERNLKDMCRECCVGPWNPVQVMHTPIWKEMKAEEKALGPIKTWLAASNVYKPFEEFAKEYHKLRAKHTPSSLGQPPQSFAAQQRAQNKPVLSATARRTAIALPSEPSPTASLFGRGESTTRIPDSRPDAILGRLAKLLAQVERALNSRTMAIVSPAPPQPQVVVKWVDYTNKFGLGYILNDGSVGCILRDIAATDGASSLMLPPAGVFIRAAERHMMRRHDDSYPDRLQPVPMTEPVKFFENRGEQGLVEASLSPDHFRVALNGKMNPGKDVYQHRKRERIILWKKFANYMIAYGRDDAQPEAPDETDRDAQLVTFYQRFGDVGCWVFCDGHVQFNFPDHTKIVLDATGTWCHFWHLPLHAAESLAATGTIAPTALDDRATLSYPLQTLLNFHTKPSATTRSRRRPEIDAHLQGIPAANDFRRKVAFIKTVVAEWVANGGLGNSSMDRDTRLRWRGFRPAPPSSAPLKHVWVTVGARWGDERHSAHVDAHKPWVFVDSPADSAQHHT